MSGGHFDYMQYRIGDIAEEIAHIIENNKIEGRYGHAYNFSDETLEKFKEGVCALKIAQVYAQRIDWLVSGDDEEGCFIERLEKELYKLEKDRHRDEY